ncbi:MAG: hypothetical protein ABL998_24180 [Planctomycetota bacterium]
MKHARLLALLALTVTPLLSLARQEDDEQEKQSPPPLGGIFAGEAERLKKEIEGSWMLMEYVDPDEIPLEDAASGFMTFRDGFLTWILSVEALEQRWFTVSDRIFLQTGAYRYRFDETAALQVASVLSFSNDEGDLQRDPALAFEYTVTLADGVLELSDPDGVRMTYRRIEAGEFPEKAIQNIERQRSRTPAWGPEER